MSACRHWHDIPLHRTDAIWQRNFLHDFEAESSSDAFVASAGDSTPWSTRYCRRARVESNKRDGVFSSKELNLKGGFLHSIVKNRAIFWTASRRGVVAIEVPAWSVAWRTDVGDLNHMSCSDGAVPSVAVSNSAAVWVLSAVDGSKQLTWRVKTSRVMGIACCDEHVAAIGRNIDGALPWLIVRPLKDPPNGVDPARCVVLNNECNFCLFSPDGCRIMCAGNTNVECYQVSDLQRLWTLDKVSKLGGFPPQLSSTFAVFAGDDICSVDFDGRSARSSVDRTLVCKQGSRVFVLFDPAHDADDAVVAKPEAVLSLQPNFARGTHAMSLSPAATLPEWEREQEQWGKWAYTVGAIKMAANWRFLLIQRTERHFLLVDFAV